MRFFDIVFSLLGLIVGFPLLLLLTLMGLLDTGSPIFRQVRVGRHQKPFTLIKFRTMAVDTASVATHLASSASITRFGHFLRRTKLDELPQLWNVLKGEMSLVGPRPGLFNQQELTEERAKRHVFDVRPGITGLAQVSDRYVHSGAVGRDGSENDRVPRADGLFQVHFPDRCRQGCGRPGCQERLISSPAVEDWSFNVARQVARSQTSP